MGTIGPLSAARTLWMICAYCASIRARCCGVVAVAKFGQVSEPALIVFAARVEEIKPARLERQAIDRDGDGQERQGARADDDGGGRTDSPLGDRKQRCGEERIVSVRSPFRWH